MKYIILDTETTGATNDTFGNPFSGSNKLCYVGFLSDSYRDWSLDVLDKPYGSVVEDSRRILESETPRTLVGFNIKFDLHWLRRYRIIDSYAGLSVWDCQLAHFIITGQKHPYPSLNQVAEYYGLGQKLDVVKTEYWDNGIDTDQIPPEVVKEYLKQDVMLTAQVFEKQREALKDQPQLKKLIWYNCQDLLVTAEMEWNGLKYNLEKSQQIGNELEARIGDLDQSLNDLFSGVGINWNSGDHLSAVLFGGRIPVDRKEDYIFTYKDIRKAPVTKTRTVTDYVKFPRLIEPLKGSGLKKEGFWSTAEGILRKLKPKGKAKQIIDALLERSTLGTKRSRYYHGFPKLYKEMDWTNSIVHTNLNHAVAQTGRLSSTKPNIQNLEEQMRQCVVTRF